MKKLTLLLFLISLAVLAFGQQAVTGVLPGYKIALVDGSEHTLTFTNTYKDVGCIYVTVEVISCNAAGVQITASAAASVTWTNINNNAAASKTIVQYCFVPSGSATSIPAVKVKLKGTAADVVKVSW